MLISTSVIPIYYKATIKLSCLLPPLLFSPTIKLL